MKKEDLFEIFGEIADEHICSSEEKNSENPLIVTEKASIMTRKQAIKNNIFRILPVAACLIFVVGLIVIIDSKTDPYREPLNTNLPALETTLPTSPPSSTTPLDSSQTAAETVPYVDEYIITSAAVPEEIVDDKLKITVDYDHGGGDFYTMPYDIPALSIDEFFPYGTQNKFFQDDGATELPVYKNATDWVLNYANNTGGGLGTVMLNPALSDEEMTSILKTNIERLGGNTDIFTESVNKLFYNRETDEYDGNAPEHPDTNFDYNMGVQTDNFLAGIDRNGNFFINDYTLVLPKTFEYKYYSYEMDSAEYYNSVLTILQTFAEKESAFLNMEKPAYSITVSSEYSNLDIYKIYDKSSGNFRKNEITFRITPINNSNAVRLDISRSYEPQILVDNYPIISYEQAKENFLTDKGIIIGKNRWLTDDPITEENIVGSERIYVYNSQCHYYLPFYRFYLQGDTTENYKKAENITTFMKENAKNFYVVYVPAVEEKYLINNNSF